MDRNTLDKILADHKKWLYGSPYGKRADLQRADLQRADLRGADLRDADLQSANLQGADLRDADLQRADLRGAYLRDADLQSANLQGANLQRAYLQRAYLQRAYLQSANLQSANLQRADLQRADLQRADLRGADLRDADLQRADLRGANLRGAYLQSAKGIIPEICTPLPILADQPGELIAYKLVNCKNEGIYNGGLVYHDGTELSVDGAETDANVLCGAGINVSTLDWILREWKDEYRVKAIHFYAKDIAAIPTATDGKFRLHRCRVGTADENEAADKRVRDLIDKIVKQ